MSYTERKKCIFCKSSNIEKHFIEDFSIPLGSYNTDQIETYEFIPFNILKCNECFAYQTLYLGDLHEIYKINHADGYGSIRNNMNKDFSILIKDSISDINGIVEIGAGGGALSDNILSIIKSKYTIIDPFYFGSCNNKEVINNFIEDVDLINIQANTVIMSHVFEHFYEPCEIINKISQSSNIKYISLNFPDLETYVQKGTFHVLNPEHTFYVNNDFIVTLFNNYNFELIKRISYKEHSVFFIFERKDINKQLKLINLDSHKLITNYYNMIHILINKIHNIISIDKNKDNYIWPCSMHTIYLFTLGLNKSIFKNILDNSESKINKYLYGYNIKCISFNELIKNNDKPINIFINGGCFNKELSNNSNPNINFHFLNEL